MSLSVKYTRVSSYNETMTTIVVTCTATICIRWKRARPLSRLFPRAFPSSRSFLSPSTAFLVSPFRQLSQRGPKSRSRIDQRLDRACGCNFAASLRRINERRSERTGFTRAENWGEARAKNSFESADPGQRAEASK